VVKALEPLPSEDVSSERSNILSKTGEDSKGPDEETVDGNGETAGNKKNMLGEATCHCRFLRCILRYFILEESNSQGII
jgi:hypothetical protein